MDTITISEQLEQLERLRSEILPWDAMMHEL